jgi:glycosyltransferase involved in cell wall biosynthesis
MADPKKPKILYLITKSNWGGAQAYAYTLATAFARAGNEVVVALGGTGEKGAATGRLADELTSAGVRIVPVPSFTRDVGFSRELKALREVYRIIKAERPDAVHLNSSKAGGIGALASRLAGVKNIIFTSHGLAYDEKRSALARALIWISTLATFLLCHSVIVISSDTYRRARALPFCASKIHLIYNGIAPSLLRSREEARAQLLPEAPNNHSVWIGTIAELTRNKDLESLVRAAALLKKDEVPFTLCIIGVGEEQEKLAALIAESDLQSQVHLLGFVADARAYLAAFDIFTLVSTKEGLPYVLLEAAQPPCAVVATRIPGTTDIIDDSTGLLVPPNNPPAIANALKTLIHNPENRTALGAALQKKVRTHFSIEKMLSSIAHLYAA